MAEHALVGVQTKAGAIPGSFDGAGRATAAPPGASELDFEEDLLGGVRVLDRAQVALLVPFLETRRTSQGQSEVGGGLGDLNASARYDFTFAGSSPTVPGLALLGGITLPTGSPPDAPSLGPLATGATGTGAWQLQGGAAVEQAFGPWLFNASVFAAERIARTVGSGPNAVHEKLGTQWTFLLAAAYVLPSGDALALSTSYMVEGNATLDGSEAPATAHRLPTISLAGTLRLGDAWRLQAALLDAPPISGLGQNQPASAGVAVTLLRGWM